MQKQGSRYLVRMKLEVLVEEGITHLPETSSPYPKREKVAKRLGSRDECLVSERKKLPLANRK